MVYPKYLSVFLGLMFLLFSSPLAKAQFSLLPTTTGSESFCQDFLNNYEVAKDQAVFLDQSGNKREDVLGCAIKTGRISLAMIPYFLTYISNFLLSLVGLVCVLFIVIGGYQYIFGGLGDNKEKGKKTISHALIGLSVATLSWIIVNIIIAAVTS